MPPNVCLLTHHAVYLTKQLLRSINKVDMGLTPEERLLRAFIKNTWNDKGYPVKQEVPVCPNCHITVDITDPSVVVEFREKEINGRTFVLAEPYCPLCSILIKPLFYINN